MRYLSRVLLLSSLLYALCVVIVITQIQSNNIVFAQTNHVVISQVQVSSDLAADDEFVEVYNPTNTAIDMTGWRLGKKTANGTTVQNLVTVIDGTIAPHSYFLFTPEATIYADSADQIFSTSNNLTNNNTILLFSDAGATLVDKVAIGEASDFEGNVFPTSLDVNQSILRKATEGSTSDSLLTGGAEARSGNSYDTDNNAEDFVLINQANPRSSKSPAADPSEITPTIEPTSLPTTIPTVEPTIIPTAEPTVIVFPTDVPTPTIKLTQTPSPILTQNPEPATTPVPSEEPIITPKIIVNKALTHRRQLVCMETYRTLHFFGITISLPQISCKITRL